MMNYISKFFDFLLSFWQKLPEETKQQVIQNIVNGFHDLFRRYYRQYKKEGA